MLYLIYFTDGTFTTTRIEPKDNYYQPGTFIFRITETLTLAELSDWIGYGVLPKGMTRINP
jgi:hypothetical protein